MSEEEMILDYPRLKLEYTRLHEDYRRLQSKLKAVEKSLMSDKAIQELQVKDYDWGGYKDATQETKNAIFLARNKTQEIINEELNELKKQSLNK